MNVCHHPQEWQLYLCHSCGIWALMLLENLTNNLHLDLPNSAQNSLTKASIFTGWQGWKKRVPEHFDTFKSVYSNSKKNLRFCCTWQSSGQITRKWVYATFRTYLASFSQIMCIWGQFMQGLVWLKGHIIDVLWVLMECLSLCIYSVFNSKAS